MLSEEQQIQLTAEVQATLPADYQSSVSLQFEEEDTVMGLYGGLFFIGVFLSILFLIATILIIYYKQISEGYEDRNRFEIMRKVGMSRREVKSSINRQILMVFFLPLLMAVLHISMAFPLIQTLLQALGMPPDMLFLICTGGTVLVFALVYGMIYIFTARSYYRILEKAE